MIEQYPQAERKLVYRVLHGRLTEHPELGPAQIAHTLAATRAHFEHRAGVITDERDTLLRRFADLEGIMKVHTEPAVFDSALAESLERR